MDFSWNRELDQARVASDASEDGTLFPLSDYGHTRPSPRAVCEQVGLNWMAALLLHEKEWLSFNPEKVEHLTPPQEAELRFLGCIVAAGCDGEMLGQLLAPLRKPYCYRVDRLLYNWEDRSWELRPTLDRGFHDAEREIDRLADMGQIRQLEILRAQIEYQLRESQRLRSW
jgi:hypothetical protein